MSLTGLTIRLSLAAITSSHTSHKYARFHRMHIYLYEIDIKNSVVCIIPLMNPSLTFLNL
jgi:hypothetical protein